MNRKKDLNHIEEKAQTDRDYHDHHLSDLPTLEKVLFEAIEIMENSKIPYALMGGVASKSLGRPRVTHDIDLFIRPDDADKTLVAFEQQGFISQKRDPTWLYKAWKDNILVDIIFKSSGDIYFDEEVEEHVRRVMYLGKSLNAISPEDFLVIKAAAHQEHNPHHWHDALAVLKQGNLDWDYLLRRAKNSPRRVLSLLIYGQSNDIAVPNEIIQKLYSSVYEAPRLKLQLHHHPYRPVTPAISENSSLDPSSPTYTEGKLMEALTGDERIAEQDIKLFVTKDKIVAKGEVYTEEQKKAVDEVIAKIAPKYHLSNQIEVRVLRSPEGNEFIR